MFLKLVWFGSKICVVSIKIRSKAIHYLQSRENVHFLLPPLIILIYTGCRLDQTLSKCIASFQKVKVLKCKERTALHFQSFTVFPLWESVMVLWFVVRYFMSILVLQFISKTLQYSHCGSL